MVTLSELSPDLLPDQRPEPGGDSNGAPSQLADTAQGVDGDGWAGDSEAQVSVDAGFLDANEPGTGEDPVPEAEPTRGEPDTIVTEPATANPGVEPEPIGAEPDIEAAQSPQAGGIDENSEIASDDQAGNEPVRGQSEGSGAAAKRHEAEVGEREAAERVGRTALMEGGDASGEEVEEGGGRNDETKSEVDEWAEEIAAHDAEARAAGKGRPAVDLDEAADLLEAIEGDSALIMSGHQLAEDDDSWTVGRDAARSGPTGAEGEADVREAGAGEAGSDTEDSAEAGFKDPGADIPPGEQKDAADAETSAPVDTPTSYPRPVVELVDWYDTQGHPDLGSGVLAHYDLTGQLPQILPAAMRGLLAEQREVADGNGASIPEQTGTSDTDPERTARLRANARAAVVGGLRSVEEFIDEEFDGVDHPSHVVDLADWYEHEGNYGKAYAVLMYYEQTGELPQISPSGEWVTSGSEQLRLF